jgi:hypothetical protein
LIATLCAGALWSLFLRSGIPYELDGTVVDIEVGTEKLAGIDDVWIVQIDERRVHLDYPFARALVRNQLIHKGAWSRTADIVAGDDIHLTPSREFWGMAATAAVLAATLWALARMRTRLTSG